ncbi:MmcQ/YjbR family DNA-binding protein [Patulibacter sp.]|uniref:MmcQ/YjbR family DNA-binding protein n=1 Tax=Patulibacter sp. TaxID=1912859 RepID=UPI002724F871|nr:MmcQ/YjbR family DNA-binding protein [Patulibacter sp.]MDO9410905.1 MmcQ/YjbR family DNA-binding protein [Patulibacter sp.]
MPTLDPDDVRAICLGLPEAEERTSHGNPAFFAGSKGRMFAAHLVDHHGDGRIAVWLAAPDGAQSALVDGDPDAFFVPPYVGHRGWIGVHLDRGLTRDGLAELVADAFVTVAPARLARQVEDDES